MKCLFVRPLIAAIFLLPAVSFCAERETIRSCRKFRALAQKNRDTSVSRGNGIGKACLADYSAGGGGGGPLRLSGPLP